VATPQQSFPRNALLWSVRMSDPLKVGSLARRTGLSVRTLHHYDELGLLCPSQRTP